MAVAFGPLSTYVVPETLKQMPTGISWSSIPYLNATEPEQYQSQVLLCQMATSMCDSHCNQVLRCTSQTETLRGPGSFRVNALGNGTTRLNLAQWPVLNVTQIRVANASAFPYQWTTVPPGSYAPEQPPLLVSGTSVAADAGTGGQSVILGPGYAGWDRVIQVTYEAGYPHCGITVTASAGDETLQVDDCAGWAPTLPPGPPVMGEPPAEGAGGVIQDTTGAQEAVTVTASSVPTGPGILSLSAPLTYDHSPGVLVSAMPGQIQWAATLFAASMALTRGATSTTIQSNSGRGQSSASGHQALREEACHLLGPYRRVI